MMNDKAQMMVLESVVFAITILISLVFLYQLSPTSTVSTSYTNDLQIKGDSALQNLYNSEASQASNLPQGFPKNKLTYYLITDDYGSLILSNLKNMLPPNTMFNIKISNGTKTVFWCNSKADNSTPLALSEPVAISHYIISIHPQFFNISKFGGILGNTAYINNLNYKDGCDIAIAFGAYDRGDIKKINEAYRTVTYDIILEMCYI